MIQGHAPVTFGGRCERHLKPKPCEACAEESASQARQHDAAPLPTAPMEMLRFFKERFEEAGPHSPSAARIARQIEAMLDTFPHGAEFTPRDYEDAQRYQFLSLEGVMWFGGEKCFRSSHMLDRMVDRGRDRAARERP